MLTLHALATNPPGKGSAHIFNRGEAINNLKTRMSSLDQSKRISLDVYSSNGAYVLFFSVGSEKFKDLFYDIVFLVTPTPETESKNSVSEYKLQVMSNIPAFAFTYLFAANEKGIAIEELKDKFDQLFYNEQPTVRNPEHIVGFEKSLMFAVYYLGHHKLFYKRELSSLSKGAIKWPVISRKFRSFKKIMELYKEEQKKERALRQEAKKASRAKTQELIGASTSHKSARQLAMKNAKIAKSAKSARKPAASSFKK